MRRRGLRISQTPQREDNRYGAGYALVSSRENFSLKEQFPPAMQWFEIDRVDDLCHRRYLSVLQMKKDSLVEHWG